VLIAHQPSFSSGILEAPVSSCAFAVGRKEKLGLRNEAVGPQINGRKRGNASMHQKAEGRAGRIKKKRKKKTCQQEQTPYATSGIVIIW